MTSALVLLAVVAANDPYVRSRVSPGRSTDHCLYWAEDTNIVYRANAAGNPETPGDTEFTAFNDSFKTWNAALNQCSSLTFTEGPRTNTRVTGWVENSSTNENVLLFRQVFCSKVKELSSTDACWGRQDCGNQYDCWQHQADAIAITTTTYDPRSGQILDADIELNVPSFIFSTVNAPPCVRPNYSTSCIAWDLQNTVTHEIGHMLGLDHTGNPGSTMNPTAPPGEITKRTLDVGTASFPCAVYPKGGVSQDCVIVPVSSTLGNKPGCSTAEAWPVAMLGLLALTRRRRR